MVVKLDGNSKMVDQFQISSRRVTNRLNILAGSANNLLKAGSDHVSFRKQKDAKITLVYSNKFIGHISVILETPFYELETPIWSNFAVQNAGPSLCTVC